MRLFHSIVFCPPSPSRSAVGQPAEFARCHHAHGTCGTGRSAAAYDVPNRRDRVRGAGDFQLGFDGGSLVDPRRPKRTSLVLPPIHTSVPQVFRHGSQDDRQDQLLPSCCRSGPSPQAARYFTVCGGKTVSRLSGGPQCSHRRKRRWRGRIWRSVGATTTNPTSSTSSGLSRDGAPLEFLRRTRHE
jgi:hypothetical protein